MAQAGDKRSGPAPSAERFRPARHRDRSALAGRLTAVVGAVVLVWTLFQGGRDVVATARQDDPAVQATATREAELAELDALRTQVSDLQTQVAELSAPPTPTIEPTPVPPAPASTPLEIGEGWTVTVTAATAHLAIGDYSASGLFVEVVIEVTNNSNDARRFPHEGLVLTDGQGRSIAVAFEPSIALGTIQNAFFQAWETKELRFAFDMLPDAGESFVLESTGDPTFRVAVALTQRG